MALAAAVLFVFFLDYMFGFVWYKTFSILGFVLALDIQIATVITEARRKKYVEEMLKDLDKYQGGPDEQ